jgi:hypothetical protein
MIKVASHSNMHAMGLVRFICLFFLLFSITSTYSQQIDFKEFVRADSNIINKNTIFNWYWSSFLNRTLKIRHIREYEVSFHDSAFDTVKVNTLAFDQEGRIKRWNAVAYRYAGNGGYLGFVDTIKSEAVLPNKINYNAFTDFYYYSETRDPQTNLLTNSLIIPTANQDTIKVIYQYNPILYTRGEEKEINGNIYLLPDGPKCYLQGIKLLIRDKLVYERFLVYELYE